MQKVSKTLYTLCTFQNIFPLADIHDWFTFSRARMLEEFLYYLEQVSNQPSFDRSKSRHRHRFIHQLPRPFFNRNTWDPSLGQYLDG